MATEEANLIQPQAMSDNVEIVEDSEVPAENKNEEQSTPQGAEEVGDFYICNFLL